MDGMRDLIAPYLTSLLVANLLLTLVDASIGYHVAPLLAHRESPDGESFEWAARMIRRLLAGVVALYAFLSCLAYFREEPLFLAGVTVVILLDIGSQLFIRRRMGVEGKG